MSLSKFLLLVLPVLICVAFITLMERKVLGIVGNRPSPNKVSFLGVLQPLGDAGKLINKESNFLFNFSMIFYYFSSIFFLISSLIVFSCLWINPCYLNFKFSLLVLLLILGLNSLNAMIIGWSTMNKYSLMGSLRTVSQLISYEACLYLCLFFYFCFSGLDMLGFTLPYFIMFLGMPLLLFLWVPAVLAEMNRTPFDFSEGESELVSGFNTEFGSLSFTLIFLSEYGSLVFFSILTSFLFFSSFFLFSIFFFFFFLWIRSVLPRHRYDKLMLLSWKVYIPFLTFIFLYYFLLIF